MKDLPFSFYEIFAIFIPGFILINVIWIFSFSSIGYISFPHGLTTISLFACFAYILGQVISHISKVIFEELIIKTFIGECCLYLTNHRTAKRIKKFFLREYTKNLPGSYSNKFLQLIGQPEADQISSVIFVNIYAQAQSDDKIMSKLEYWQRLYLGFRNLCLTFILISAYSFYKYFDDYPNALYISLMFFILSITMFYRYLSFFKFYCRELILWFTEKGIKIS